MGRLRRHARSVAVRFRSEFRRSLDDPNAPLSLDMGPDSRTLLIAFGGMRGMMGNILPFEFFKATGTVAVKRLFVRDLRQAWYHRGVPGHGSSIEAVEYAPWRSFRQSEDSRYVALTMPRVLSRLPYGQDFKRVTEFNFEEEVDGKEHNNYSWMGASWAYASRITDSFAQYGWMARTRSRMPSRSRPDQAVRSRHRDCAHRPVPCAWL